MHSEHGFILANFVHNSKYKYLYVHTHTLQVNKKSFYVETDKILHDHW